MTALPAWPYPRLCAHRGAGKLAPENTLTAMRVGLAHGYSMFEFDVKLAADNVAFLLHDATLDRTTSGRGRADAMPWRELSRLDAGGWHSAKYAGEMLPTFAAIARWARAHGVFCNPEILTREGVGITEEGCLSVPGIFDEVKRAATIRARAQDVKGKFFEVDLDGLAAVCLQHEMDHLEGKLFVDYLSDLKRERIRKKLDKDRKERASRARETSAARAY